MYQIFVEHSEENPTLDAIKNRLFEEASLAHDNGTSASLQTVDNRMWGEVRGLVFSVEKESDAIELRMAGGRDVPPDFWDDAPRGPTK